MVNGRVAYSRWGRSVSYTSCKMIWLDFNRRYYSDVLGVLVLAVVIVPVHVGGFQ
jgi:hypothetical protein